MIFTTETTLKTLTDDELTAYAETLVEAAKAEMITMKEYTEFALITAKEIESRKS